MSEETVHPGEDASSENSSTETTQENDTQATDAQPDNSQSEEQTSDTAESTGQETDGASVSTDVKNQVYEIAGKKYDSFDKAVAAVNKIAGDNSRVYGDNQKLSNALTELQSQVESYKEQLSEALAANKAWDEWHKAGGDPATMPAPTKAVEQVVKEVLKMEKVKELEEKQKAEYKTQIDALPSKPDYAEVYPKMMELATRLGDALKNISPNELYDLAKGAIKKESKPVDKIVKDTEKKVAARTAASKVVGGNPKATAVSTVEVSPELANYLGLNTPSK